MVKTNLEGLLEPVGTTVDANTPATYTVMLLKDCVEDAGQAKATLQ